MKYTAIPAMCLLIMLGACKPQATELAGADRIDVLKYADPVSDNVMTAYNEGDHAKIIRDFDEKMKAAFTEKIFKQNREMIFSKIGLFKSKKIWKVIQQGPYVTVIYNGEFEKENNVKIKLSFLKYVDKHLVAGFFFDSPKLAGRDQ